MILKYLPDGDSVRRTSPWSGAGNRAGEMLSRGAKKGGDGMDSVYKVIELVGTSDESWEKAAAAAVELASRSLRDLRVAEVSALDMSIENGVIKSYRAKVKVSFKYED